jgi:hypothetical protein
MSRSLIAWSWRVSLADRSRSSFTLQFFVCRFLLFTLFRWSRWHLSVGSPHFYVLNSILNPFAGIEFPKEVFTSKARWMPLTVEWNASANMLYLLKNLLLVILIIFKLKCNNLILKKNYGFECFVCMSTCILASLRITRSGSWKTDPSFLRWFCHIRSNGNVINPLGNVINFLRRETPMALYKMTTVTKWPYLARNISSLVQQAYFMADSCLVGKKTGIWSRRGRG